MNFANPPDTARAPEATPRAREECARLKRYIKALKQAHRKEIDGLLAQAREQARQIAELRIESGHAAATVARRQADAQAAGQGCGNSSPAPQAPASGRPAQQAPASRRPVQQVSTVGRPVLKVEDIVPLPPWTTRRAG